MLKNEYFKWMNYKGMDQEMMLELREMSKEEIKNSFTTYIKFGTGGLRALMGPGINRINIYTIRMCTEGYAQWLKKKYSTELSNGIVIAYDNRHNSYKFAIESAKILIKHSIKVFIFDSLKPTPELSYAIRSLKTIGGIMITASHNSKEYNGYKIYDSLGCQATPDITKEISKEINNIKDCLDIQTISNEAFLKQINYIGNEIDDLYYQNTLQIQLNSQLRKDDLKIVFSSLHGTAFYPVSAVLKKAGYTIIPVENQCYPDENFINTKSPNPEDAVSFEEAIKVANNVNADLIIVTDPDCDRLGVAVKSDSKYQLLTGNQLGTLLLYYILHMKQRNGELDKNYDVYSTIVSSSLGDLICSKFGISIKKTLTGFKYIGKSISNSDNKFLFGFEESCGYLVSDCVRDKDAVQAALLVADATNYYKKIKKSLIDVLNDIYYEFGFYLEKRESIQITNLSFVDNVMNHLRDNKFYEIENLDLIQIEDYYNSKIYYKNSNIDEIYLPKSNVIKYVFKDNSWVAIRPSGTEPKLKIYYFITSNEMYEIVHNMIISIINECKNIYENKAK